jgi:hypothetical protein
MQDYEKLGVFYLGRRWDSAANRPLDQPLLYDDRDLTTHALCVGMTGSGKTGLGVVLLEEAAIDGIPAIVVDPKGDLGNLLLTFPGLSAEDFGPWIDPDAARRAGCSTEDFARQTADRWKAGLAESGQLPERIARLRSAVDMTLYTPASNIGLPLTVMKSFAVPDQATMADEERLREAVAAASAGLLGLLGLDGDPLKSREHILLANIFEHAWRGGRSLDMTELIRAIQSPPMDKVGVIDLESFFAAKERFEFAMQLNNLLASPSFSTWMQGEPLDIQRLLWTSEGKPRLSILSIAHLSDAERMFFVTLVLSELTAWMRRQSGTSSLRALFYMDEIFGYFPPGRNPPSKTPMLTLLKQARAYGLGIVLATQNPVDLDYKGLANCGTWFLGRLQTERDKLRVLDGLEGAATQAGAAFDRAAIDRLLSGLASRVFLMNNVHEDRPVLFQSRWTLSYLRGPLSRDEIARLTASAKTGSTPMTDTSTAVASPAPMISAVGGPRPVLPPDIVERFVPFRDQVPNGEAIVYRPYLYGAAKIHFQQATSRVDLWKEIFLLAPVDAGVDRDIWARADMTQDEAPELDGEPEPDARFAELPPELSRAKKYSELATWLKDFLYRQQKLPVWTCTSLKETSRPSESEADFRARLAHSAREDRDEAIEKLRRKFAPKLASLAEQLRKAEARVEKEQTQATTQVVNTGISILSTAVGAMFGRKLTSVRNINRAAGSVRSAAKIARERQDVEQASATAAAIQARIDALDAEFEQETLELRAAAVPDQLTLEQVTIAPKKSDINVSPITLVWQAV